MTAQLLIYQRVAPINLRDHRDLSIKVGTDYGYARAINSVPLMAVEFIQAASEYAIVFAGTEEAVMPAAILGARDSENLFVDEAGVWHAKYIPAFIRRYPFVFSSADEGKNFTLCIDESFAGCNREGRGERLFDADGNRTQYTEGVLGFMQEFQAQFLRTQAFCTKLKQLDLLEPMQVQMRMKDGQVVGLGGFSAVGRERLRKLSGEALADLARTDELELIYLHLHAMRNFGSIVDRAGDRADPPAAAA